MHSVRRRLLERDLRHVYVPPGSSGRALEIGPGRSQRVAGGFDWVTLSLTDHPSLITSVMELPFKENTFACVQMLEVLQYVRDPVVACGEVARVLQYTPRGWRGFALISVPFCHAQDAGTDRWRFTEAGFRAVLDMFFETVRIVVQHGGLEHLLTQRHRRLRGMIPAWSRVPSGFLAVCTL